MTSVSDTGVGREPFPFAPYRPGSTPRPLDDHPIYAVAASVPSVIDPDAWQTNVPYRYGVDLCNGGYFWEAHEVWEPVWMRARPNSRERALLQGLIQLANACLKDALGQKRAARRIADLALVQFEAARSPSQGRLMGLDIAACLDATRRKADCRVHLHLIECD